MYTSYTSLLWIDFERRELAGDKLVWLFKYRKIYLFVSYMINVILEMFQDVTGTRIDPVKGQI